MTARLLPGLVVAALAAGIAGAAGWTAWPPTGPLDMGETGPVRLTVLFDNTAAMPACKAKWGFACLIEGTEKTILFDTGADDAILQANARALGKDLATAELVVISHDHRDHTGGLAALPAGASGRPVFLPETPGALTSGWIRAAGAEPVIAGGPVTLCRNVFLTGRLDGWIAEQALVIRTRRGLVVLTGCAHPGIIRILERARALGGLDVDAVLGGFHLAPLADVEVAGIVARFRELGVKRVGATHCTGDGSIRLFREEYGKDFVEMGAGREIKLGGK